MSGVSFTFPGDDTDRVRVEFFRLGFQYYISGRFAFFARLFPVSGNAFHHAAEMMMKGHLSQHLSMETIRGFGHNLPRLWENFKSTTTDTTSLASFDSIIADLHRFERIRYPDRMLSEGMDLFVSPAAAEMPKIEDDNIGPLPGYSLALDSIDELIRTILAASSVNPRFHASLLPPEYREFISRGNPYAGDYLEPSPAA